MALISDKMAQVKPSATIGMTTMAMELRASGHNIISLSAGEPDFDTPGNIKEAARKAMDLGLIKYTPVDGLPELKEAIIEKFRRENALSYTKDEITVASGGKHVIFNALFSTINMGDEVIIPAPYWVSYPDMVRLCGGVPIHIETSIEKDFKISPENLEQAITPRSKWLILNSPSNPTGACYSQDELKGLAEVLLRHQHVWILTDDIYEHLLFDGQKFATIAEVEPELKSRTLTMNGVSKSYAMTGWRIGFAGGPKPLIDAMRKVMSQSTSCASAVSQYAAIEALNGPQDFIHTTRSEFEKRRNFVVSALDHCQGLSCPKPAGAFYVYPSISELIGKKRPNGKIIQSDEDFSMALLHEKHIATVFGAAFGCSPNFRISYATSMTALEEACARIADFCAEFVG